MIKTKGNPASGYGKPRFGGGMGELWQRATIAAAIGINISDPVDQLDEKYSPFMKNVRVYGKSQITNRPGLRLKDEISDVHSITQLQDEVNGLSPFVYGAGTELFLDSDVNSAIAAGYSGKPFTSIIARPSKTPHPWMFIADENKMSAIDANGNYRQWGINPPRKAPMLLAAVPSEQLSITDCEALTEYGNTWNKSVGATTLTVVDRVNTVVNKIIFDSGSTGWAVVVPTTFTSGIQANSRIKIDSEFVEITQILPAIANTTVEGIVYHSGSTGKATVQLATATKGLQPNSIITVGSETVRVIEVVDGLDNRPCFVADFTTTHVVGEVVSGNAGFRCYAVSTHTVGAPLVIKAFETIIDPAVGTPKGIGNIRLNAPRDLSQIGGKAITDEDELRIGIYVSDINRLIEGRIWLDVDSNTTATYDPYDLSRNYFFYAFRPDDLQAIADFTLANSLIGGTPGRVQKSNYDKFNLGPAATIRDNSTGRLVSYDSVLGDLQRLKGGLDKVSTGVKVKEELLKKFQDNYGISIGADGRTLFQIGSGREQWYQLTIKIKDLQRIGEDKSKTLKDVKSVMVNFQVTTTNPASTVTCAFSSFSIGGGYNLDSYAARGTFSDAYYYRYTGWNDDTGDESLPSPTTRVGILSRRQKNSIEMDHHPDEQITKLNVYRYGGTLKQWIFVGRVNNPLSGTVTFVDDYSDESIANNRLMQFDKYAPVPIAGLPVNGFCNVVGNRVTRVSGDAFDASWAQGNEISIDGKTHLLFAQPEGDIIELTASAGTMTNVEFVINSPIKLAQPLGRVFGPYGAGAEALTYFFVGDALNPGFLYWTNPDDPNCSADGNYIEITGPNEPLVTGVMYDGRAFVFSSERMWQILPTRLANGAPGFAAQEVANSRGVVSPWAVCVDKLIYFVSKDGIYVSEGGQPTSLTQEALGELFPHDGISGDDFGELKGIMLEDDTKIRLTAYSGRLYFDHVNTVGEYQTLVFNIEDAQWILDKYADGGVSCRYGKIGGRSGDYKLVCATATKVAWLDNKTPTDYDVAIDCEWHTLAFGAEERRAEKLWGDYIVNWQGTGADDLTVEIWENSFSTLRQTDTIAMVAGRNQSLKEFGDDFYALDLGAKFSLTTTNNFQYFNWEPSILMRPERSSLRNTDWDDVGEVGSKLIQGVYIEADTLGTSQQVNVVGDEGQLLQVLTINHDGQQRKVYSFDSLAPTMLVRLEPQSSELNWRLYDVSWIAVKYPEKATTWQTPPAQDLGYCGWKHLGEAYVDIQAETQSMLTVTIDGVDYTYSLAATGATVKRIYLRMLPIKGKLFSFKIHNTEGVRVFQSSCIHVGDWGRGLDQPYRMVNPFGGENGEGAQI